MELEVEKIIREKVRMAEQANVAWNKEWVWSRIETPAKLKIGFMWYAAAAVIAGLLCISLYWVSLTYENNMMAQLNRLELLMDQLPPRTASIETTEICTEVFKESDRVITTYNHKPTPLSKKSPATNIARTDIDNPASSIELPAIDIRLPELDLSSKNNLVKIESDNRIRPIIGKIPNTQNALASTKSKEIKIQIFQSEGTQQNLMTDAREYKILTAHFNNN